VKSRTFRLSKEDKEESKNMNSESMSKENREVFEKLKEKADYQRAMFESKV
jgi:hypothetical protein